MDQDEVDDRRHRVLLRAAPKGARRCFEKDCCANCLEPLTNELPGLTCDLWCQEHLRLDGNLGECAQLAIIGSKRRSFGWPTAPPAKKVSLRVGSGSTSSSRSWKQRWSRTFLSL